jgi:hypothetical protein
MTARREQVREAIARHRKRRKRGLFLWPIIMTKDQLDQLEVRGYLEPDRRGERVDECDAVELFLADWQNLDSAERPLYGWSLTRQELDTGALRAFRLQPWR